MGTSNLYKSFTSNPYKITKIVKTKGTLTEEPVNLESILGMLSKDVQTITELAEWCLHQDAHLLEDIENYTGYSNTHKIGESLGISVPEEVLSDRKSGKSRFTWLLQDRVIREALSWSERVNCFKGESTKYVSAGWRRTINPNPPSELSPKIALSITDKQYAEIIANPKIDGIIKLKLVIQGEWYFLYFQMDNHRFTGYDRVTLPDITIRDNGSPRFHFTCVYPYLYQEITSDYVVSVDVGIANYATIVVLNKEGEIVHASTLSKEVKLLAKSVKSTSKQVTSIRKKLEKLHYTDPRYARLMREIADQRESNSRKKKALAIQTAQEISYIAHLWDNAVIAVEDLSWISNTMQNGRWNRGEMIKRLTEYAELNGSRVIKVNPAYSSQDCSHCGSKLVFKDWHDAYCATCDTWWDRDINACVNLAKRAFPTVTKISETRKKSKSYLPKENGLILRTPVTGGKSISRDKGSPTGKCENKKRGRELRASRSQREREVSRIRCSRALPSVMTVTRDVPKVSGVLNRTLERQQLIIPDYTIIKE